MSMDQTDAWKQKHQNLSVAYVKVHGDRSHHAHSVNQLSIVQSSIIPGRLFWWDENGSLHSSELRSGLVWSGLFPLGRQETGNWRCLWRLLALASPKTRGHVPRIPGFPCPMVHKPRTHTHPSTRSHCTSRGAWNRRFPACPRPHPRLRSQSQSRPSPPAPHQLPSRSIESMRWLVDSSSTLY